MKLKNLTLSAIGLILMFACTKKTKNPQFDEPLKNDVIYINTESEIKCRFEIIHDIDTLGNNKYNIYCDNPGQASFLIFYTMRIEGNPSEKQYYQTRVSNTDKNNVLISTINKAYKIDRIMNETDKREIKLICKSEVINNKYSQYDKNSKNVRISCDYNYPVIVSYYYKTKEYCSNNEVHDGKYCLVNKTLIDTLYSEKPYSNIIKQYIIGSNFDMYNVSSIPLYPKQSLTAN